MGNKVPACGNDRQNHNDPQQEDQDGCQHALSTTSAGQLVRQSSTYVTRLCFDSAMFPMLKHARLGLICSAISGRLGHKILYNNINGCGITSLHFNTDTKSSTCYPTNYTCTKSPI